MSVIDWNEEVRNRYFNLLNMMKNAVTMTVGPHAGGPEGEYNAEQRFDYPDDWEMVVDPSAFMGKSASGRTPLEMLSNFNDLDIDELIRERLGIGGDQYAPADLTKLSLFWDDVLALFALVIDPNEVDATIGGMYNTIEARTIISLKTKVLPELGHQGGIHGASIGSEIKMAQAYVWARWQEDMDSKLAELRFQTKMAFQQNRVEMAKVGIQGVGQMILASADLQAKVNLQWAAMNLEKVVLAVKLADGVATDAATLQMKYGAVRTELGWRHWMFPFEVLGHYGDALGSLPAGGGYKTPRDNVVSNVLAGALTGAALGSQTDIKGGTGWGSILGAFAGYFGSK